MEAFGRYYDGMTRCRNCDAPLTHSYCAECGQKDLNLERPVWHLVGEVLRETFELDGRAARTIKTLFAKPGVLTSEFLAGRRRHFTPPLRLYLVISIGFFVLIAWFAESGALLEAGQDARFDAAVQARFMSEDLPRLMFVLLPLFALLLKLVFHRRYYFDHLIFSLHLHSAAYVVLALMLPFEQIADTVPALMGVQAMILVYFLVYFAIAVRRVYHSGWIVTTLKSAAILFGYMILVSVFVEATSNFKIMAD